MSITVAQSPDYLKLPTRDEFMEEILENQKEKEFKREIKRLKEDLRSTGMEPKKKKIRLIDVYDKRQRDVEEKRKEEERRELERRGQIEITRRRRMDTLLEKIRSRSEKKKKLIMNRGWLKKKKEKWEKLKEEVQISSTEKELIFNEIVNTVKVREVKSIAESESFKVKINVLESEF